MARKLWLWDFEGILVDVEVTNSKMENVGMGNNRI